MFCLCIFESDTVKSDFPDQIFCKMMLVNLTTSFSVCIFLEIKKKHNWSFSELFFSSPDPKSEKIPCKSTNKKILALVVHCPRAQINSESV